MAAVPLFRDTNMAAVTGKHSIVALGQLFPGILGLCYKSGFPMELTK